MDKNIVSRIPLNPGRISPVSPRQRLLSRRQFLGQASCAAIGSTALFNTLLNLRMANTAAAQAAPGAGGDDDYRALVCLFFAGGSDSFNMLVPYGDAEYNEYLAVRGGLDHAAGGLALSRANNEILPLTLANPIGKDLGVHSAMPEVQTLFNNGNAAWLANVGTLVEPTTRAQLEAESIILPLGLYSHSDQIRQWQTSVPQSTTAVGWAGRSADVLASLNNSDRISMNISVAGTNVWQAGNRVVEYVIDPFAENGSVGRTNYDQPWGPNPAMSAAIDSQLGQTYQNIYEQTFASSSRNAIDAHLEFSAALDGVSLQTVFPQGYLGAQLQMVARTIAARQALGMRRQTFFVQFGGWDHHDEVIDNMAGMLPMVSQGVNAFYNAMVELQLQNNVTLFTASDFGRTLTSNGAGSDHAWGGNHLVVGGAVNGQNIYGTYPDLYQGNPLDTERGRLIPTTSVDEYFGELAMWFGVSPTDLPSVLPNVANFFEPGSGTPLGFMNMS